MAHRNVGIFANTVPIVASVSLTLIIVLFISFFIEVGPTIRMISVLVYFTLVMGIILSCVQSGKLVMILKE